MQSGFLHFRIPILFILLLIPVGAEAVSSSEVISDLMCPCGTCDEPLATCDCPEADQYRAQIVNMMAEGQTKGQIVEDFVGRFGDSVLADKMPLSGTSTLKIDRQVAGFLFLGLSLVLLVFMSDRYLGSRSRSREVIGDSRNTRKNPNIVRKASSVRKNQKTDHYDEILDDFKYD